MKGIILAGGKGTRLYPLTAVISKGMLPVYDKPMIYYPLSTLMLSGITEVLIISTPNHLPHYQQMLGNGSNIGIKLEYKAQEKANGIAEAFILGENFIGNDNVCLILGDNIFYGDELITKLHEATNLKSGGQIFGYYVDNPRRYGVLEIENNKVIGVEEKPSHPKSNYAIPGIYFFDNKCIQYAKKASPSDRGELEVTTIIQNYIDSGSLQAALLGGGIAWLDTGTHENLIEASSFVYTIEKRQGLKIACLEEIAFNKGLISFDKLKEIASLHSKNEYGVYLTKLIKLQKSSMMLCQKTKDNTIVSYKCDNFYDKASE